MESGGPSITAQRVAAHRLGFTRVPAPYGDPAADEALAADVTGGQQGPEGRMKDYLAARTRFFDQTVVAALRRGVDQVVIGAAGYDGRALRYAKPGVRWFEVDHPATQLDKRERLDRLGLAATQVRFVPADFTSDPIADRLREAGLKVGRPALFLLEGVAVYLERPVLETVLSQLREVAAAGSPLAISVSLSGYDEAARTRFQAWVASMGEPARTTLDAAEAAYLLARTGWQLATEGDPSDQEAGATTSRRRSAGLLTARAAPVALAGSAAPAAKPEAAAKPGALSLSALLSQALVAFTIEFDNEAEHRLPHRTTNFGASDHGDGPWLVSLAMWETCMRFVGDEPITVAELEALARTPTNLDGMRRWGYITVDGAASKTYKASPKRNAVLRAGAKGLRARQTWLPMAGLIEQRWLERFGPATITRLRDSLSELVGQLDPGLPDCLPILGANLLSRGPDPALPPRPDPADPATLPLSALLSRVLLSFAIEYERGSSLSLATSANLLRILDTKGTRLRDLPLLTGVSKEAISWAMGVLSRARLAAEAPDPAASRGKVARLTSRGLEAQATYHDFLDAVGRQWQARYGEDSIRALRDALEALATSADGEPVPLSRALEPYPDNWRAMVPAPATLPYYPMVLHRGGYPDGS
ncbi:MAG: class I SAM-dependent methyltransferase [Streptosporangiaceae bacterium]